MKINYDKFIQENFEVMDKDTLVPIPFHFNAVQRKYIGILTAEYPEMEGIREIVLKARQEGMSSLILALFATDFLLRPYSVSICISHRKDATDVLFKKVKSYIDSYFRVLSIKNKIPPEDIAKQFLKSDNRNLLENATNGAMFYIGTAGAKVGGRGGTARNILFSECFGASQQVIGENGFIYSITNLPNKIRDGNGALITPIGLRKIKPTESMKRIKVYGNFPFPIEATIGHKLWARTGTRYNYVEGWKEVKNLTQNDYLGFPLTLIHKQPKSKSPFSFELTRDFGEFCGWYLAEGCTGKNRIELAIHTKEKKYIDELLNKLNIKHSFYTRGNGTSIYICNTDFKKEILSFFGEKQGKMIPDKIWGFGTEFIRGLLRGIFLGDGRCRGQFHQLSIASIRPQIIVQLKRLLISLRLAYPGIQVQKANTQKDRNNKEIWTLTITGRGYTNVADFIGIEKTNRIDKRTKGYNKFFHFGTKYSWAKIHSIKDMPLEKEVYDVILDKEPHSFTVLASVSHNCAFYQDTDLITAQEIVVGTAQQVPQGRGMIFIESTANGTDNYYQQTWEKASRSESVYRPRFFGWKEFYTEAWVEEKRKEFPNDRMWKQEYPADPDEAFVVSGTPYFNVELLKKSLNEHYKPIRQGKFAADGEFN